MKRKLNNLKKYKTFVLTITAFGIGYLIFVIVNNDNFEQFFAEIIKVGFSGFIGWTLPYPKNKNQTR